MKYWKTMILITILIIVIGVSGCNRADQQSTNDAPVTAAVQPGKAQGDSGDKKPKNREPIKSDAREGDNDSPDSHAYISITYGRANEQNTTGREMVFYTYDLVTKELREECVLPFDSKYASGVVSRTKNTVYYSQRSDSANPSSADCLCAYEIESGKSTILETENFSYNDITMLDPDTLLVMAVTARHTITPARFDLLSRSFSYTADVNNEPFELYSSGPAPLNYNYNTHQLVYIYQNQDDMYSPDYLGSRAAIDTHIALLSDDLMKNPDEIYTLKLKADREISWVTQISEHELLVKIIEMNDTGYNTEWNDCYYSLVFGENQTTFTPVESPYPHTATSNLANCVTPDGGETYYCKLYRVYDTSGLFSYHPATDELIPILLNDDAIDGHIVNFFMVGPQS